MPNTIALAKNYISLIDEVYRRASVTADISSNKAMARAGTHANEIIYPQIAVTGLGDYDRNSGYTTGAVAPARPNARFLDSSLSITSTEIFVPRS